MLIKDYYVNIQSEDNNKIHIFKGKSTTTSLCGKHFPNKVSSGRILDQIKARDIETHITGNKCYTCMEELFSLEASAYKALGDL